MGIVNRIASLFQGFNWLIIPAAFLTIVFSAVCRGYAAYLMGDRTAKDSGRLSLNPINHFDIVGFICMVLFGLGWVKPVPVNSYYFKHPKLGITLVSLVGPASNLILAFIALLAAMLLMLIEIENAALLFVLQMLVEFFILLALLNVGLAVFNLLPIPPLVGSKILFALLPDSAYELFLKYEQYGIFILFVLINIPIFSDFLMFVREMIFNGMLRILSAI